ncbi:MAG TPA: choice-of-anchor D domain-containing protein [Terriglobia bacterium]|nr:choice-of-anchor D domain-containing protein [Terriglobia bacterium]
MVLLPGLEQVLTAGGDPLTNQMGTATNTAEMIDLSQPTPAWQYVAPMNIARQNENLVLLPDGTVLAVGGGGGGGRYTNPVYQAEDYNPTTNSWTLLASQQIQRTYHSTALLLPDGRVFSGGSDNGVQATDHKIEVYSPPYLQNGTRPSITSSPSTLSYGQQFTIVTPDASSITRVALIKVESTTHATRFEGRFVDLSFTVGNGQITATSPPSGNYAPPGYYYLDILNSSGVPAIMPFVLVTTTPIPAVALSPTSLSFGNQAVGTSSAPQTVTLTNTGSATLNISGVTTGPDYSQTNTCASSVAAGASCTLTVTFTPTTAGTFSESLTMTDNATDSPETVSLSGTGTAPSAGLSPGSLTFAGQQVGTSSAAQNVTLTNTGSAVLTITSIVSSGDFSETNTCGTSLAAGASCAMSITFTPTTTGTRTGAVTIADNASGSPQTVSLTGTGTAAAVTLSPTSLNFGTQYLGTSSTAQIVTLTNTGTAALSISGVSIGPDYGQTNNCGTSVGAGATCTLNVTFTPTMVGTLNESLVITDNAAGSPQSVALTGTGAILMVPAVSLSPSSLIFGDQTVGTTSGSQPATLTNTGNAALSITSIAPSGDFALATTGSSCPYSGGTVNPGASCTIDVSFTPTLTGTRTGAVTVIDNAAGSPQFVALTGTGLSASPNSVPQINQPVVPGSAAPGGPGLTLTVNGTGFLPGTTINWNVASLATSFVSNRQLTATVPATDTSAPATAWITVVNPVPGGGTSNVVFFPVTNSTASLSLARFDVATGNGPQWVGAGDFNRDGKLDLALTNRLDNTISVLLGNGDGTFTAQPPMGVGSAPVAAAIGDLNGDGIPDLAVADNGGNSVSILLGNGDGTFTAGTAVSPGNGPAAAAVDDLNGDGKLDLVVANAMDNTVAVLLGNGDGTFGAPSAFGVGAGPQAMAVADFNGDGVLDLASANSGDGTVSILLGNGNGTFAPQSVMAVGPGPLSLTSADLNGDGIVDLAVANSGNNTISILLGNGIGGFTASTPMATGNGPAGIAAGDLNGDGILDLAVANTIDNTVSLLLGTGAGAFQQGITSATGAGPASVAPGDFNNDGRLDVATADQGSASASILLQASTASLSATSLSFGNQAVGSSSSTQTLTLTNTGSASLTISRTTIGPDYTETNTCGSAVAAGASCTFSVTFTPTTTGALNESLTITDNAAGSPQSVSLAGTGTAPAVTLSPLSLMFASQQVGTSSAPQTVTLTNSGTATLTIGSIVASGDFSQTNTCGASVAAGANCAISVTFTPTSTGTRMGAVTITDNGAGSPQSIALSGTGTAPPVTLTPPSLTFASQQVGTSSSPQAATLTNSGTATLTISSIAVTGTNKGDFTQTHTCGASLAVGKSCTINVTFKPTATGTRTAAVSVTDAPPAARRPFPSPAPPRLPA